MRKIWYYLGAFVLSGAMWVSMILIVINIIKGG